MTTDGKADRSTEPAAAYVAPFLVYLLGVSVAARVADAPAATYPLVYVTVAVLTTLAIAWALPRLSALRPHGRVIDSVAVGLLGIAGWIFLSELRLESQLAEYLPGWLQPDDRVGYDPRQALGSAALAWSFIGVRVVGLAVLVPLAEELFWRGFLLRWTISERWREVPIGRYEPKSFAVVTVLFTLAHPEWFAAAFYCALLNGYLYWKRDLWRCVVAHGVSNAALAAYVLSTGSWWLW